jgi:hypothetical protein
MHKGAIFDRLKIKKIFLILRKNFRRATFFASFETPISTEIFNFFNTEEDLTLK